MHPSTGSGGRGVSPGLAPIRWHLLLVPLALALGVPACDGGREDSRSGSEPAPAATPPSDAGPAPTRSGFPAQIRDASGSTLTLSAPPARIVSLVPSATRILQALGAGSLLVGRTEYDTTPSLAHLPSVGGGLEPSLEALILLEPELVIRFAGESDLSTPQRLEEIGIRQFPVRPDRIADVRGLILDLGAITGLQDRAREIVAEMDATLHEVRMRVGDRKRVKVAYLLGGNPPWVAGPRTFIDELLGIAGGENVFSDLKALYGPVSQEELLIRDIDLFLAPEGGEVFLPTTGVPVVRVSPEVELPGPDLAQTAWKLAKILHPEVFG